MNTFEHKLNLIKSLVVGIPHLLIRFKGAHHLSIIQFLNLFKNYTFLIATVNFLSVKLKYK